MAPLGASAPRPPIPVLSFSRARKTLLRWGNKIEGKIGFIYNKMGNGIETGLKKIATQETAKRITCLVMRILRGIPLAGLMFLLPMPVAFGFIASGLALDLIKPGFLGKKWSFRMYNSFGLHTAIRVVMDTVRTAAQNNAFFYIGLLVFDLAATAYFYHRIERS